jgi:heterotetrameric sarcosine oxidase delta subunit
VLVIICPHCGPRNSDEFTFNGEVRPRPDVNTTTPAEWRRYLYMRQNLAGWVTERWFHVSGCRRFLMVERNTETNEIRSVEVLGGEQR